MLKTCDVTTFIHPNQSRFIPQVKRPTAPRPIFRMLNQLGGWPVVKICRERITETCQETVKRLGRRESHKVEKPEQRGGCPVLGL
jgi:hypothetical protein